MTTTRCGSAILLIAFIASILPASPSLAQSYPDHLIRIVVPYGPGFAADTMARIISDRLSPMLGQPIVIENRPGGGGVVGTDFVVKSRPDGYTLLSHTMASLGPSASTGTPYDPLTDLIGIAPIGRVSGILVASKSKGFKTLQDLIAYGRQHPNALNFASLGPGSPSHIYAEKLMQLAGFDAVPIAYKGPSEAMADLIAGRVDFFALTVGTALPFVREGNLTPLAITSSKRPAVPSRYPDVNRGRIAQLGLRFRRWLLGAERNTASNRCGPECEGYGHHAGARSQGTVRRAGSRALAIAAGGV